MSIRTYIVAALAAAGLSAYLWHWHSGKVQATYDRGYAAAVAAQKKATDDADKKYEDTKPDAGPILAKAEQLAAFQIAPSIKVTLTQGVPTDAPVTECPDRSPAYRLLYNEIAAGRAPPAEPVSGTGDDRGGVAAIW